MRVIFIHGDISDYLGSSVLHGLLSIDKIEVIDYPRAYNQYVEYKNVLSDKIRGGGFTIFFQHRVKRVNWLHVEYDYIRTGNYDLIIFSDIQANYGLFMQFFPYLKKEKTILLDGSDSPTVFGFSGHFWRLPFFWFFPRVFRRFAYYKREITPLTIKYLYYKMLPLFLAARLASPKLIRSISFSIPEIHIVKSQQKVKDFVTHIVDPEVSSNIPGSSSSYVFNSQDEYFADIRSSKFGITTKRAGWDCLRHYEIAANGAVICFKDLDSKPPNCAPHGLIPDKNCLSYVNYQDLVSQIECLSNEKYDQMLRESYLWIQENSTLNRARWLLTDFASLKK